MTSRTIERALVRYLESLKIEIRYSAGAPFVRVVRCEADDSKCDLSITDLAIHLASILSS